MKKLKIILFGMGIFACLAVSKNDQSSYYVATNGSDDNPGTLSRPFKTIQKCAELVQPGSTCWLRGGIYRETVTPKASGKSNKPIAFAAYNKEQVTISGTEVVDNWSVHQDSIYRADVTLPIDGYSDTGFFANQIFIDGEMMPEARFPNLPGDRDFLRPKFLGGGLQSQGGTAAVIENQEVPELDSGWAGGQVWTTEWYTSRTGEITGGTADRLTAEMTAAWERGGFWFYLFGKQELLDDRGEWFYTGESNDLYLWSPDDLKPQKVEVKQRNYAFDLSDSSYIEIRDLNLFANTIVTGDRSTGIVIDGIRAKYISHHMTLPPLPESEKAYGSDDALFLAAHGHDTGIQLRGNNNILRNSVIDWSAGNGVLLEGNDHQVTNNIILNTNYKVSYAAPVRLNGNGHQISYNTIKRTGRDAISWDWHTAGTDGRNLEIAYNDISEFGMLNTDLGGIYVCCQVNLEGGSIHHNWIRDARAFSAFWGTRGIYLDIETFNSTIHHNVVWNLTGGQDNYSLLAGSPRGRERIYNNTFMGDVRLDGGPVDARNNIFAGSEEIVAQRQSNNLFSYTNIQFAQPVGKKTHHKPDFTPQNITAIDRGVVIPGINEDYQGKAPDIGAYEKDAPVWRAGSSLKYNMEQYER
ncbi:MAG: right-handed parallel beta-helix repeat-containing protein [Cyanobacteria bacterium J06643_13]